MYDFSRTLRPRSNDFSSLAPCTTCREKVRNQAIRIGLNKESLLRYLERCPPGKVSILYRRKRRDGLDRNMFYVPSDKMVYPAGIVDFIWF